MAFVNCGSSSLPLDTTSSWDGPAAQSSMFGSGDDVDSETAKDGHCVYDSDDPDLRGSYKLPFARKSGGRLTAVLAGVRAAKSRLPQTDGLSSEVKSRAGNLLDGYLKKGGSSPDDEERWLAPYASVVPLERSAGGLLPQGTPRDELPEGLARQLQDPSVIDDTPLYWFRTVGSTGAVDHYGTTMQSDSLRNYAQDAEDGLPFCNSHQHEQLPFGRSYRGRYIRGRGESVARSEMDVYLPFDMNVNGVDTTHFIKAVRSGVARDVSIEFHPEKIVCSLDGRSMPRSIMDLLFADPEDPDAPCRHVPGVTYKNEGGEKVRALGRVHGAHALELSPVYRGATPGAAILSPSRYLVVDERDHPPEWVLQAPGVRMAAMLAEADLLERPVAMALERHVRGIHFPDVTTRRFAGWSTQPTESEDEEDSMTVRARKKTEDDDEDMPQKATDDNPDPDHDGDDDRTPEGDTDHSHFTASGKSKTKRRSVADDDEDQHESAGGPAAGDGRTPTVGVATAEPGTSTSGARAALDMPPPASRTSGSAATVINLGTIEVPQPDWRTEFSRALVDVGLVGEDFDGDPVEQLRSIAGQLEVERAWAAWGRRYRSQLCEEIEAEGVRAFGGQGWERGRNAYQPIVEHGTADDLINLRDHLRDEGSRRLQGGRLTHDDPDGTAQTRASDKKTGANGAGRRLPAAAYRS